MTDEAKALVERLRGDWPEILVEKHWMMDSDAIDKQRDEAADLIEELDRHLTMSGKVSKALSERIEALEAEIERLRDTPHRIWAEARDSEWDEGFNYAVKLFRAALAGDNHD